MREQVKLCKGKLTLEQVNEIARDVEADHTEITLSEGVIKELNEFRSGLEVEMKKKPLYGVNTGCGSNKAKILFNEKGELDLDAILRSLNMANCWLMIWVVMA